MIAFDFDYYLPESVEEAVQIACDLKSQNKSRLYYAGGTEIISMARVHNLFVEAVVDIKSIPECNVLAIQDGQLVIGSAVTLTRISESNLFPLLGSTVSRIADHTIQGKVTLGGNIAGTIIYHEALLPLFLTDCEVIVANPDGRRQVPINQVFHHRTKLSEGEMIVQFIVDQSYLALPYFHAKKTKIEKIDYPVVTVAAMKKDDQLRFSYSALCDFPFRSKTMEKELNQKNGSWEDRINRALSQMPAPVRSDLQSSADYRVLLFKNAVIESFEKLGVD